MQKYILTIIVSALITAAAQAGPIGPIPLWKGQAPGEKGTIGPEHDVTTDRDRTAAGKRITRITNVTVPTLTVYLPPPDKRTGAAVLVFPGGAYRYVAIDIEGTEICDWLNSIGVAAILVKYRVPAREGLPPYALPLQDAQRAMGMVRAHAAEWGIDPKRVGVIGFSAGAHLSAALSTSFEKRTYDRIDEADDLSCRPDFAMLLYPGSVLVPGSDKLSAELQVKANAPPTFIVQTEDDSVRVESSLGYYAALKAAKVPVEMHLYPSGGHGYGLRPSADAVSTWPARAQDWMRSLGVL
ncbi:MAG: alpha/beta hydrolase [Candidatus Acidiferrales bacterium]|jgi:acetyl esterase/lipase